MAVLADFVSWDIETRDLIPDGGLTDQTRLRITCAATLRSDGVVRLWHGGLDPDGQYAAWMGPRQLFYMLEYLWQEVRKGVSIIAWNGAGFDFRVLHNELSDGQAKAWCKKMALMSVDPFFAMVCSLGYGVGLDTACKGMGVQGKTEGMSGSLAPEMWKESREQQDLVLEYVAQDVRSQAGVYRAILENRELRWTSRSGRPRVWEPPVRLTGDGLAMWPVQECLTLPKPDTGWMTKPRGPEHYVGWTGDLSKGSIEEV